MTKKILWLVVSGLMALSLVMVACAPAAAPATPSAPTRPTTPTTSTMPTTPVSEQPQKEAVKPGPELPKYGGTLTYRQSGDVTAWDPYFGSSPRLVYETPSMGNWMAPDWDPKKWDYLTRFTPMEGYRGLVAESWVLGDFQTITFKIRQGIHFQNIPPVNGRELTASDVVYSYNRLLGLGDGFTKPSTSQSIVNLSKVVSVTAPDKYTVVFKMSEPTMDGARFLLDDHNMESVYAREAIQLWGDINQWRRAIGSGPFIVKDYVAGSFIQYDRNPNYWSYDERYPENKLPFVDKVIYLIIPDNSTADAAMRTGKIDMMESVDWERGAQLKKTYPNIQMAEIPDTAIPLHLQVDKSPFNDIRVRKALQMAIDLKTIAATFYGGTVPGTPTPFIRYPGYGNDYDSWPQAVREGYTYNPAGAKQLLKEAGYPNGFKATITTQASYVDLLSIVKAYFLDIGVDLVFDLKESGAYNTYVSAGNAVMSTPTRGPGTWYSTIPPVSALSYKTAAHPNGYPQSRINDPIMEDLYQKAALAVDWESQRKAIVEADKYIISQQWTVNLLPRIGFTV